MSFLVMNESYSLFLTLFNYFARHFISYVLSIFLIIIAVIYLLDIVEFLHRGASKDSISLGLILEMAILKAPSIGHKILPFAVLFGSMMAFTKIAKAENLLPHMLLALNGK